MGAYDNLYCRVPHIPVLVKIGQQYRTLKKAFAHFCARISRLTRKMFYRGEQKLGEEESECHLFPAPQVEGRWIYFSTARFVRKTASRDIDALRSTDGGDCKASGFCDVLPYSLISTNISEQTI
jgi:hypothetical protein